MASDTTKRGRGRPRKKYSEEAKDSLIKHLHKELLDSQSESNNLEVHVKRLMLEKAELNDKIEQLTDEARKYEGLYDRAKGVAQALGKAVSILTTENKHG